MHKTPLRKGFHVRTFSVDLPVARVIPRHTHEQHQLVYASTGVMTVRTERGMWVVPSHRAVWMPAGMEHEIETSGFVAMRTLYLDATLSDRFPSQCIVVSVSPLLRELILHACRIGVLDGANVEHARLIAVLVDQMHVLPTVAFQLPLPQDPRAQRAARTILSAPGDENSIDDICRLAGASRRTLERLFFSETGMTIGMWRQQARVLRALQLLGAGHNVTSVGLDVGYSGTSAFVAMFKKAIGTTPGAYAGKVNQTLKT
jgi:AraC-like DNA-binding protein